MKMIFIILLFVSCNVPNYSSDGHWESVRAISQPCDDMCGNYCFTIEDSLKRTAYYCEGYHFNRKEGDTIHLYPDYIDWNR